jgi:predicted nucleic acid-binding protein
MIVLDASAVVDLLVDEAAATGELRARLQGVPAVHVPHVLDVEVASGLRRQILRGRIDATAARRALRRFGVLPIVRWEHTPLLGRALALRDRLTAADAMYVALAEALGATLLTRDARMAKAGGHRARIEVV